MKVHDGNDERDVASDLVNDPVGEPVGSAAAGSRGERRPRFRILKDSLDSAVYFLGESGTESLFLVIVIGDSFRQLGLGRGKKLNHHLGASLFDRLERLSRGNGFDFTSLKCINAIFRFQCPEFVDAAPGWGIKTRQEAIRELCPL